MHLLPRQPRRPRGHVGDVPGRGGGPLRTCHAAEDDPATAVALALYTGLADLDEAIEQTDLELEEAAKTGLFLEREHAYLDEARSLRVRARPLTHALSPVALTDLRNRADGMIQQTREGLALKYRGLRDRRIFTGIFLFVVVLLALVLLIYRSSLFEQGSTSARRRAARDDRRPTGGTSHAG